MSFSEDDGSDEGGAYSEDKDDDSVRDNALSNDDDSSDEGGAKDYDSDSDSDSVSSRDYTSCNLDDGPDGHRSRSDDNNSDGPERSDGIEDDAPELSRSCTEPNSSQSSSSQVCSLRLKRVLVTTNSSSIPTHLPFFPTLGRRQVSIR